MTTKKQTSKINKAKDTSKNPELVFTESKKPPCETCKDGKEVSNVLPKYTREEMDFAMTIVDRRDISPDQMKWLISLNNRVLNDNKQYGCGKCHIQILKNIKNAYRRLYE